MTEKRMPAFRIVFRDRNKQKFDCATVWPGRFPESFDVSPVIESSGGQYPKLALAEALQRIANKDGWLSLVAIGPKRSDKAKPFPSLPDPFAPDGGGDFDDVPFGRMDQL